MTNKYEVLTDYTRMVKEPGAESARMLHHIRALRDFSANGYDVKAGELGGLVESEANLSQEGGCWITRGAAAFGNAKVTGDALLHGECMVYDNARVGEQADISQSARVCGNAVVDGKAVVTDTCAVWGDAHIGGEARLTWSTSVSGNAVVEGSAYCANGAEIDDHAHIYGHAVVRSGHITGRATLMGSAHVHGSLVADDAKVTGDAFVDSCWVTHNCHVGGDAVLAFSLKAEAGEYLTGVHCGRGGKNAIFLKLAMAFKDHPRVSKFFMSKVHGMGQYFDL